MSSNDRPEGTFDRFAWIGLGLAALLVYTLFLAVLPAAWSENQSTDYLTFYEPVARSLLAGHGLVTAEGDLALRYPPGYPLLLAGVFGVSQVFGGNDPAAVTAFIGLCVVLSTLLVYAIARQVAGGRVGLLAALAWATYPFHLWLAKQPNSEVPFFLAFLGAVYITTRALGAGRPRWRLALIAGALIGVAALIRPAALLLAAPVMLGLWLMARQWRWRARLLFCALLLLGNLLVVAPWELWAWERSGQWIPLSTGGPPSIVDGLTVAVKPSDSGTVLAVPEDVRSLMRQVLERRRQLRTTGTIAQFLSRAALAEPLTFAKLIAFKAVRSWYATDAQWLERYIALLQLPYLSLAALGGWLAWRRGRHSRGFAILAGLLTLYSWLMTIVALSILRYMVPVMALLMVFVGIAVAEIGQHSHTYFKGRSFKIASPAPEIPSEL